MNHSVLSSRTLTQAVLYVVLCSRDTVPWLQSNWTSPSSLITQHWISRPKPKP